MRPVGQLRGYRDAAVTRDIIQGFVGLRVSCDGEFDQGDVRRSASR